MKRILLIAIVVSAVNLCIAQTKAGSNKSARKEVKLKEAHVKRYETTCIVLDPLVCCDNLSMPDFLREDSRLSVRIINVNPLMAKITVDARSDTVDYDVPDGFSSLGKSDEQTKADNQKVTVSQNLPKNKMNGIMPVQLGKTKKTANAAEAKAESERHARIEAITNDLDYCFAGLNNTLRSLQRLLNLHNHLKRIMSISIIKREDFITKINAEIRCLGGDTSCDWYRKHYDSLFNSINTQFNYIKGLYGKLVELTYTTSSQTITVSIIVQGDQKELQRAEIKNARIELVRPPADENKMVMDKLTAFMQKFKSDSSINKMEEFIDSLTSMCIGLKTLPEFSICQLPLTVNGDMYTVSPVIKNGKDTVFRFLPISFGIYGGFRLNFSTGLGFSFLNNDQGFVKEKAGDDSFHIRSESEHSAFTPSIVAFMHVYWRAKHRVNPALTIGISTSPANLISTRFFIGGSAILGQNRRLILSAGARGGQVDRLARNFSKDKIYANADYTGLENENLVDKKFRMGLFFGFSYNLSVKR